jgi:sugar (pentulose or hexulose) kinase
MLLSIDCGSTNHKVALFDDALARRAACAVPVRYTVRDGERVEFDPEWIWDTTMSLIRQTCAEARIQSEEISTIALASQAQTFTLLDSSGTARLPFISWADKRAMHESQELASQWRDSFAMHCSFPSPIAQLQVSKLAWLRRHQPNLLPPETKIVSLPSFLAQRLGGLHVMDVNLAGMSGLCSCRTSDWWLEGLKACGLDRHQMGELVAIGTSVNHREKCPDMRFSPALRVVFSGNDQTAGAYAITCRSGRLVLTLGTALVVYRYAGETPGPFRSTSCWGPYPGGGFYEMAACDEGCAALDWAVEQLAPGNETGFFKHAASAPPGEMLFFPQKMRTAEAWRGNGGMASQARAVLDGICFRARQMLEEDLQVKADGAPIDVIGGGSGSDLWLEILAAILNRPVIRGKGDILLGAAMIARPEINPPAKEGEAVEPGAMLAARYDEVYHSWLEQVQPVTA